MCYRLHAAKYAQSFVRITKYVSDVIDSIVAYAIVLKRWIVARGNLTIEWRLFLLLEVAFHRRPPAVRRVRTSPVVEVLTLLELRFELRIAAPDRRIKLDAVGAL